MAPLTKILLPLALAGFATAAIVPVTGQALVTKDDDQPPFMTGLQSGQGTFFDAELGACGFINDNSEHIAAVSNLLFDAVPGYDGDSFHNPVCGRQVTAYYKDRSTTVTITDSCADCDITNLDFTPTAFADLEPDLDVGRIDITWEWV
ncbi:hypothetical protein SCLCIDRAFT_1224492 [Scleroderma citrinum Foug A]|uniref:RlpA-like protein double-psi beta-barrel domain-containing protein n=1 Tax=Scleroderma citrinum Foug A TaxID=1036808 RepID=A0A0C2YP31_9AGAM|nr:hypothetical protein SCLCIDRAFT_1224492 [Scleroderma citrinum Foug A]